MCTVQTDMFSLPATFASISSAHQRFNAYNVPQLYHSLTVSSTNRKPSPTGRIVPPVTFEDIEPVFTKALSEIVRGMELLDSKLTLDREQTLSTLQRVLVILLHLAALMARLLEEDGVSEEVSTSIHKAVYSLVKLDIKVSIMDHNVDLIYCTNCQDNAEHIFKQ